MPSTRSRRSRPGRGPLPETGRGPEVGDDVGEHGVVRGHLVHAPATFAAEALPVPPSWRRTGGMGKGRPQRSQPARASPQDQRSPLHMGYQTEGGAAAQHELDAETTMMSTPASVVSTPRARGPQARGGQDQARIKTGSWSPPRRTTSATHPRGPRCRQPPRRAAHCTRVRTGADRVERGGGSVPSAPPRWTARLDRSGQRLTPARARALPQPVRAMNDTPRATTAAPRTKLSTPGTSLRLPPRLIGRAGGARRQPQQARTRRYDSCGREGGPARASTIHRDAR